MQSEQVTVWASRAWNCLHTWISFSLNGNKYCYETSRISTQLSIKIIKEKFDWTKKFVCVWCSLREVVIVPGCANDEYQPNKDAIFSIWNKYRLLSDKIHTVRAISATDRSFMTSSCRSIVKWYKPMTVKISESLKIFKADFIGIFYS